MHRGSSFLVRSLAQFLGWHWRRWPHQRARIGEATSGAVSLLAEAAENKVAEDDRQLQAEAAAGMKLIAAEAEWSEETSDASDSTQADASSHAE